MELSLSPKPEARNAVGAAGKRGRKRCQPPDLGGLPWGKGPLGPRTGKLFSRDRNRPKPLENRGLRPARRFFSNRSLSGFGLGTATYQQGIVQRRPQVRMARGRQVGPGKRLGRSIKRGVLPMSFKSVSRPVQGRFRSALLLALALWPSLTKLTSSCILLKAS